MDVRLLIVLHRQRVQVRQAHKEDLKELTTLQLLSLLPNRDASG